MSIFFVTIPSGPDQNSFGETRQEVINGYIITNNGGNGGSGGSGGYVLPNNGGLIITLDGASSVRFFFWKTPNGVECRRL